MLGSSERPPPRSPHIQLPSLTRWEGVTRLSPRGNRKRLPAIRDCTSLTRPRTTDPVSADGTCRPGDNAYRVRTRTVGMETRTIERVGVISLALMVGSILFLFGVLGTLVWIVVGLSGGPFPGLPELVLTILGSAVGGAVLGGIAAIFFNLAAVVFGGLEITFA